MKIETAVKKVVTFLETTPGATKAEITAKTKIAGIELTNVIKALRKEGRLIEEGEGKEMRLSISAEAEVTEEPSTELEIPVEDEQDAPQGKTTGRNKDKYKLDGELYGKGRIVQAIVRKYVAENPKVTYKQLKEVFPDELLNRFGIFQDETTANSLSGSRPRYFMSEEKGDGIKLGDRKVVFTSSQFTATNLLPLMAVAKKLGMKIAVLKRSHLVRPFLFLVNIIRYWALRLRSVLMNNCFYYIDIPVKQD
jgi:hypothetical protein